MLSLSMRPFALLPTAVLFVLFGWVSAPFEDHSAQQKPRFVTIKVRNGRTGLPVWIASPYVFLGNASGTYPDSEKSYRRTAFWNDAKVDVTNVSPPELRVWKDFISRDCRFVQGDTPGMGGSQLTNEPLRAYSISQILSTGIVTENKCSSKTSKPEPGVLTIYVIPLTFRELWDL